MFRKLISGKPLLPRALPRLSPILITGRPHIPLTRRAAAQTGGQVGIARPKLGFEGRLSTSTPSTPHPPRRRTRPSLRKGAGVRGPEARRPHRSSRPTDPKDYSPQHAPRPPARPGARARWRRRGPTGTELGADKRWHGGGGDPRLRGSWTYPAGQVSAEREVGRDSLGLRGPAPTHAPPVGTLGAVDRPTGPRTYGPRGKAAPSPAGPRSCGARGWGPG